MEELFPESNGIDFPPIREVPYEYTLELPNFQRLFDRQMSDYTGIFLARGHFIVGWKHENDIQPLSILFGKSDEPFVFDTDNDMWVSLPQDEFEKLGPNRRLALIQAHDKAAASHRPEPLIVQQAKQHAHHKASQVAQYAATSEEKIQKTVQDEYPNMDYQESSKKVQQVYHDIYKHVYEEEYKHYLSEH